jgi:hypothetical protein
MARVDVFSQAPFDLSGCAYYKRYIEAPGHDPNGTCSFGCREEPSCVTDEPSGGWPVEPTDMTVVIR